jgi:glucose-6-phosphate 1-dehydrogenase
MNERKNIILFGATGDLANRKLIPAIYDLFKEKNQLRLIGVARRALKRSEWEDLIATALKDVEDKEEINKFLSMTSYINGDFKEIEIYSRLKKELGENEEEKTLFYLSIPQTTYNEVLYGISTEFTLKKSKVAIEKPFGNDLNSFDGLLKDISRYSDIAHVYPIDHYLGKEWIYEMERLSKENPMLSALWKNDSLDAIQLSMLESEGVKERGRFYEQVGALKDVFQNHLLQIIATALRTIFPNSTKEEIITMLELSGEKDAVVFGQYVAEESAKAYREEHYVAKDSLVETYFAVKLRLFERPIYIRSGKRLGKDKTYLTLNFKNIYGELNNSLSYNIQPERHILFAVRDKVSEITAKAKVHYQDKTYQILFSKMLHGEKDTFFPSLGEIRASWKLTERILEAVSSSDIYFYPAKSMGPHQAEELLKRDGREWK